MTVQQGPFNISHIVNNLVNLQKLSVDCQETKGWDLSKACPLKLKSVTELSWTWREPCNGNSTIRFSAESSSAPAGSWTLIMPQLSAHSASQIERWIGAHFLRGIALELP
jgi:hypothetical protein